MRTERWENGVLVEVYDDGRPAPAIVRSPLDILSMLTPAEYASAWEKSQTSAQVALWLDMLRVAGEVRSDDPRTAQGCALAVAEGILTPARVLELFGITVEEGP